MNYLDTSLAIHRSLRVEGRYPGDGTADGSFDERRPQVQAVFYSRPINRLAVSGTIHNGRTFFKVANPGAWKTSSWVEMGSHARGS
jgi:hypothetical protein